MSDERGLHGDVNRVVRSWLREDRHEDADRVLVAALNTVDTTPQRRTTRWSAWRDLFMDNNVIRVGLVAAAAVIIAVIAINLLPGSPSPGGEPSSTPIPSVAAPSEAEPSAAPSDAVSAGPLDPGTYTFYDVDGTGINVAFELAATGWEAQTDGIAALSIGDEPANAMIIITTGALAPGGFQVYTDPCQWQTAVPDPPTDQTAEAVIAAMAEQPDRNPTTQADRSTADGLLGRTVDVSVPADINFADCDNDQFRSWGPEDNARFHQGPGQMDSLWAFDIGGTVLMFDAVSWPETPADLMNQRQAILDSMTITTP